MLGAEFMETLHRAYKIALAGVEFFERFVVSTLGFLKRSVDGLHVFDKAIELVVKGPADTGDFLGIAVLAIKAPEGGDGFEDGEEGGGGGQGDMALESVVKEGGVVLQGEVQGGLNGDKEQDKLRGLEVFQMGVIFLAKALDMGAKGRDVFF